MIQLSGIHKVYGQGDAQTAVLKNISLTIKRGEYIAIRGRSGSGKSTLLNILGCLDKQSSGKYALQGIELAKISETKLSSIRRKHIGFVFQRFHLLPHYSALRNVELPLVYSGIKKEKRLLRAKKALLSVGLGDRLNFKPSELSGGQQQRVAIARSIMNKPEIIIADEPTGSLDALSSKTVMAIFDKLHKAGTTIIMVTHDDEIGRYAEREIVLQDGELVSL